MNLKEFMKYASDILKKADIEAPVLEAGVMLCHALGCDRSYLYSHDDRVLDANLLAQLDSMVEKRLSHVPLQYIIGYTEFMSLKFIVSPAVLIPRQDTEILVEKCIETVKHMSMLKQTAAEWSIDDTDKNKVSVLDMCTGSGCIAVSIAHYCPDCRVVACDISGDAIDIAKINSEQNGTEGRLELYLGDLFSALDNCPEDKRKIDIIVSNPPYIETDVILELQSEVRDNEPLIALDGGKDGLAFYRRIIEGAPKYLNKGGCLAFEIGYDQGQSVKELMQPRFEDIAVFKDIGGNDRVVIGRMKSEG